MGLFMDEQGLPISIETFPGNTLDHLTMIDALSNTVDKLNLSRFIFVGDRGMCSGTNMVHLLKRNHGYIISKSIEKTSKKRNRKKPES
jgi:transposase